MMDYEVLRWQPLTVDSASGLSPGFYLLWEHGDNPLVPEFAEMHEGRLHVIGEDEWEQSEFSPEEAVKRWRLIYGPIPEPTI